MSYFWKTLWMLSNTKLKFYTACYLQTNGQTEVVNRNLGQLFRCLVRDHITTCDQALLMAEFAYNNSINWSTGTSPFEVVTGVCPRLPIDLVPLPVDARISADAKSFFHHMQQVHNEVRRHISAINAMYK